VHAHSASIDNDANAFNFGPVMPLRDFLEQEHWVNLEELRQRELKLDSIAEVRSDEIGTNQKQDQLGAEQLFADLGLPLLARVDGAVMPTLNRPRWSLPFNPPPAAPP
jgi:hypothetical protein